jgi:VWFA-related protein
MVAGMAASAQGPARTAAQTQTPRPSDQGAVVRIASEEVLLDIVARDKKGRPVGDLKVEDIEVFENGTRQQISSFRRIDKNQTTVASAATPAGNAIEAKNEVDPMRQINLVTMIFERLNNESRLLARDAAIDFLKNELRPNMMVAVFAIDNQMSVLQQFTNDRDQLKQAVDRATGAASSQFAQQSETIMRELENYVREQSNVETASANAQQTGGAGIPQAAVAAKLAEITINTLRMTDDAQRQQQGTSSIYSLLAMVREQRRLAGRKTVIYFSEGLPLTPALTEVFRNAISSANRANVTFYAVDARGLQTSRQTDEARAALNAAVSATQQQQRTRGNQPVTPEQAKALDTAEGSILKNSQANLASLAESTGGFLVANTNDVRTPMKRVAAELSSYYEVSYTPSMKEYDGRFREIQVRTSRADVVLQTRSGYFALPPNESGGPHIASFEMPMLAALGAARLPRDFEYRATTFRFESDRDGIHHMLLMEVPLENLSFQIDQQKKVYRTDFALMSVIKNPDGSLAQRFSQNYPLEGPLDRLEALKRGNVVFLRNFRLPPGRFTMESVVHDHDTGKFSARRAILMVSPPAHSVAISSIAVIKRVDPIDPSVKDPDNPLRFAEGKIIPNLGDSIKPNPGAQVSFFFVVYPNAASNEKPRLTLEFLLDGQVIGRGAPELSQPDARGRIPYIASAPIETFKAGRYELRVVVTQGQQEVEEHAFFVIE